MLKFGQVVYKAPGAGVHPADVPAGTQGLVKSTPYLGYKYYTVYYPGYRGYYGDWSVLPEEVYTFGNRFTEKIKEAICCDGERNHGEFGRLLLSVGDIIGVGRALARYDRWAWQDDESKVDSISLLMHVDDETLDAIIEALKK